MSDLQEGNAYRPTCVECRRKDFEITKLRAQLDAKVPLPVFTDEIREVFDHWRQRCHHPQAKLTQDRRARVRARMREGYTLPDLKCAIDGAAKGAYTDGRGHRWDDLSLICRSGSNVERFMQMAGPSDKEMASKVLG